MCFRNNLATGRYTGRVREQATGRSCFATPRINLGRPESVNSGARKARLQIRALTVIIAMTFPQQSGP